MKQHTIQKAVSISGHGLHTAVQATVTLQPAPENHGYKFQRTDLEDRPIIKADVSRVVSTNRSTVLGKGDIQIGTVEHLLSALVGMGIDNVLIEIDAQEVPIMDGSAQAFVEAIQEAGVEEQSEDRKYFVVEEPITFRDEETGAELLVIPSDTFQVTTMVDFNSKTLGQQYAYLESTEDYTAEIAPCRTFVFFHELEALLAQDLIKGGDLENAIVIADQDVSQEQLDALAQKLGKPSIKVDKQGVLNTVDLKFQNEVARHKLLDVIGDLSLVGVPIKGRIVATKPGHTANVAFAEILKKHYLEEVKLKGRPKYDPNVPAIYDTPAIMELLPHRHPFLLVDKIIELSKDKVVGIKNITFDEYFFSGHFPNNPVFPGVLQVEALAQTGGILALSQQDDPHGWDTYFVKIDKVKFKQKVLPGDTLIMKMELMAPIRRGIVQMQATAYVGNKIVSEGELTAQIVKRPD
ncbi:MAG: bifunctional UDP-3-O-[3-hydroxymyristoyl] N-acetylglucosamine deacetylase/3-hydroxyacyl-ACP dehydratase [Bacteroidota bacterium]